ncbi:MAG TPA: acyl-CoA synthetase [Vicinamibacterales bacterium]|nr:acyl-CoA synthetase [Vicinamibacterales bacterium]
MIIASDGTFSAADLESAARRVAAGLLASARTTDLDEARAAFFVHPSFAYAAVQLGIWRSGGIAVPLAISHPEAELDYVIRDSGASHVVADDAGAAILATIADEAGARFSTATSIMATETPLALPAVSPTRRAMIIYTSGTTGRPKGAVTTHATVTAQIESLIAAWGWSKRDRLLLALPLHHVHGIINGLGTATTVGASCEMLPTFDPRTVWERLASGDVTVFTAVPTIYRRLADAWDAADEPTRARWSNGARSLRLMMSGSAALPMPLFERWQSITGHRLLERYGMTEIGMALSNPVEPVEARRPGTVGMPLPGVEVRLIDEHGAETTTGPGEIEVRGPNVFLEYWQRPEETRAAFREGWFRTGDIAEIDGGAYRILGRASVDIIKTGGFKVSALEIEDAIRAHPAVADCAVVGVADDEWGERVSACVQLALGSALSLDDLQRFVTPRLAPYKIPRALRAVEALPRNAMGKVIKPDVAALFAAIR